MVQTGNLNKVLLMAQNGISLEVINFDKELKRIEEEVKLLADLEIEGRVAYATQELRTVTPVDTGKARSGWYRERNLELDGSISHSIVNDVEYISILNEGHSKQAPRYFIEQVLIKIGILTPA